MATTTTTTAPTYFGGEANVDFRNISGRQGTATFNSKNPANRKVLVALNGIDAFDDSNKYDAKAADLLYSHSVAVGSQTDSQINVTLRCADKSNPRATDVAMLDLSADDPRFQIGYVDGDFTTETVVKHEDTVSRTLSKTVVFPQPYILPPKVAVFLTGLELTANHNIRIWVKAVNVTANGFTAELGSWGADTVCNKLSISWVAHYADDPTVFSGNQLTEYGPNKNGPDQKPTKLALTHFTESPDIVFSGLTYLDCGTNQTPRDKVETSERSVDGFRWKCATMEKTELYQAGFSYLVMYK